MRRVIVPLALSFPDGDPIARDRAAARKRRERALAAGVLVLLLTFAAVPGAAPGWGPQDRPVFTPERVTTLPRGTRTRRAAGPAPVCGVANGLFHCGLDDWATSVSGAGGMTKGSVTWDGMSVQLSEGNSFLVSLQQTFCVPAGATQLTFELVSASFDQSAMFIPDAFEVALLGADLLPVLPPFTPQSSAFFNLQEDGSVNLGKGTMFDGFVITADISGLTPGTEVTLFFDLIGPDGDMQSSVQVDSVRPGNAEALYYGSGVNPAGSLVNLGGPATIGTTLVFGVDNPLGSQPAGSTPILTVSLVPDPAFPSGTLMAGAGMAPDGIGELLICPFDLVRPPAVGAPWPGPGQPVPIECDLAKECSLVGLELFVQGGLISPAGDLRLTEAVRLTIGN